MSEPELLYREQDSIGFITFNRPQARNAFTFGMYERIAEIVDGIDGSGRIKALVLTGAGEQAFAAGTDISQFRSFSGAQDALDYEARIDRVLVRLESCLVPTIAAIAGACTGGGLAVAGSCDLRIAMTGAKFGMPIARTLGNCLSMSNLARLTSLIGAARVKELIFTSKLVSAEDALSVGLVSEVLPDHAALQARATEMAVQITKLAPLTLRSTKMALRRLRDQGPGAEDHDLIRMCYESADFREGLEAFLAKRKPEWRGV